MVRAEVEEVETGVSLSGMDDLLLADGVQLRRETNTFFFTMAKEDHEPIGKMVIPQTYSESMHYLEGKRRLQVGDEMRKLYQGGSA
jgi:acyl-coenzyme A thioesterase 9